MSACTKPSEVFVCEHVNAGQPYDLLVMDADAAMVDTAFCHWCAEAAAGMLEVVPEYEAAGAMDEWEEKLRFNARVQVICRDCARGLHIPDRTPDGEHVWERPVQ